MFSITCLRTANALARLRLCAGSPEPLLVAYVISILFSCAGSILSSHSTLIRNLRGLCSVIAAFPWYLLMYLKAQQYTCIRFCICKKKKHTQTKKQRNKQKNKQKNKQTNKKKNTKKKHTHTNTNTKDM